MHSNKAAKKLILRETADFDSRNAILMVEVCLVSLNAVCFSMDFSFLLRISVAILAVGLKLGFALFSSFNVQVNVMGFCRQCGTRSICTGYDRMAVPVAAAMSGLSCALPLGNNFACRKRDVAIL